MLADDIRQSGAAIRASPRPQAVQLEPRPRGRRPRFRALIDRLRAYFLTQEGKPRGEQLRRHRLQRRRLRHRRRVAAASRGGGARSRRLVADAIRGFRRDLNAVMSRGVWRIFARGAAVSISARSKRTRCSISPASSSARSSC